MSSKSAFTMFSEVKVCKKRWRGCQAELSIPDFDARFERGCVGLTYAVADLCRDGLRVSAGHYAWWLGIHGRVATKSSWRLAECVCTDHVDHWAYDDFY